MLSSVLLSSTLWSVARSPEPNRLGADRSVGAEAFDDLGLDRVPEQALDIAQQWPFVDADERDRVAFDARPAGATDAVHVVGRHHRQLEVDDVGELGRVVFVR
jgi:hypothetical protein